MFLIFVITMMFFYLFTYNDVFFLCVCRGFPVWLKYVSGISFRTDNGPFKVDL